MTKCPKCESTKILGPRYVKSMTGEALQYTCFICGFVRYGRTADQVGVQKGSDFFGKFASSK